jgi:tetratricopeptide (TPR) repeat protein
LRLEAADAIIISQMRSTLLVVLLAASLAVPARASAQAVPAAGEETAAYFFLLGRHLESLGRIDEAVAAHKRALELEPESAELRAELAGIYARQDKATESLAMAEAALQKDPANREANRILGSIYAAFAGQRQALRPGDNPADYASRAIAALEKARQPNTFDIGLELTLGRLYVQTEAYDKAVPLLQRVVADQPGYAEGSILLAAAQEGAGKPEEAIATLENALEQNPKFYRAQVRVAELYERQRDWTAAAEAFGRAQALNPRAPLGTRRAAALINGGQPAEARELLERSLASSKPDAQAPIELYLLAEAQRAMKDLPAAEATAQKLLARDPADTRGLHVMSLILQDKGDRPGAERVLRDLIAKDPLDANALNSLGYMYAERGERLDEAVALLQRALKIEPENPSYLDSLGWAYFQQGRLDLADKPLTDAAARLSDSSVVQEHLGDLRFRQQRFGDAAAAWERALAGDGQSIDRAKIQKKIRDVRGRLESR